MSNSAAPRSDAERGTLPPGLAPEEPGSAQVDFGDSDALAIRTPRSTIYVVDSRAGDGESFVGYQQTGVREEDLTQLALAAGTVSALLELYPGRTVDAVNTPAWAHPDVCASTT